LGRSLGAFLICIIEVDGSKLKNLALENVNLLKPMLDFKVMW
jgi:hypothetical protein